MFVPYVFAYAFYDVLVPRLHRTGWLRLRRVRDDRAYQGIRHGNCQLRHATVQLAQILCFVIEHAQVIPVVLEQLGSEGRDQAHPL